MPAQLWKCHSGRTFCFLIQISVHQAQYDAKSCRETFQVYPLGTGVGTGTFTVPMVLARTLRERGMLASVE